MKESFSSKQRFFAGHNCMRGFDQTLRTQTNRIIGALDTNDNTTKIHFMFFQKTLYH